MTPPPRRVSSWAKSCRHFTGIQNKTCKEGIAYDSVRTGPPMASGFVCIGNMAESVLICPKFSPYTAEEVERQEREMTESIRKMGLARAAIVASKRPQGMIDCPACGRPSTLSFQVSSYNGHIHAMCATVGCVSWME